jgi:hypothetical protein
MGTIEYDSNNSGGGWWLDDDDWQKLEEAGWVVHWFHDENDPSHQHKPRTTPRLSQHHHGYDNEHMLTKVVSNGDRWLGALATSAAKQTDDPSAAVAEWERVTGKDASAVGCNCCGEPHNFTYTDDEGNSHYSSARVTHTELGWS